MIAMLNENDPEAAVVAIAIGNTSIALGMWYEGNVSGMVSSPTGDLEAFDEAFDSLTKSLPDGRPSAAVVAAVVPAEVDRIRSLIEESLDKEPLVVGEQLDRPIEVAVKDVASVGMDRICCAAAAYDRLQHSCAVVDFGTAITVDLVSDEGLFMGGAILPGLRLQLAALREHTAQLPAVAPAFPDDPVGKNTVEAMQNGVCRGIVGAVRELVEAYATALNHWPQVVATGGDAVFVAEHCDFLDNIVPDLCLRGVGLAYTRHANAIRP